MTTKGSVEEHFERCVELYGVPIDIDYDKKEPITRAEYEQLRADLMMLLGMAMALWATKRGEPESAP